jgi:hypothetical protein
MKAAGLQCSETLPDDWVVHCKKVGRGWQALTYLGRYLYRGVLPEQNILSDKDGIVSFSYRDHNGKRHVRDCLAPNSCGSCSSTCCRAGFGG